MKKLFISGFAAITLAVMLPVTALAAPSVHASHVAYCATTCGGACVAQCAQAGARGVSVCAQASGPCAGAVCMMP